MSLILRLAGVTCAFLLVPAALAGADVRQIDAGGSAEVPVTGGFVYWTYESPGVTRVRRTDLASGLASTVGTIKSGIVTTMKAGGGRLAVGAVSLAGARSMVYVFDSNGRRMAAQTAYHPERPSNCGAVVFPGAVSPSGELTWQRWTAVLQKGDLCGEYSSRSPITLRSSVTTPGGLKPRRLFAPQRMEARELDRTIRETDVSTIVGISNGRVLTVQSPSKASLMSQTTGRVIRRINFRALHRGGLPANMLAGDGSVIGWHRQDADVRSDYSYPVLYGPDGQKTVLDAAVPGMDSQAFFCGERIVQVTFVDFGDGNARTVAHLRDHEGQPLATLLDRPTAELGYYSNANCDDRTLVVRAEKVDGTGVGVGVGPGSRPLSADTADSRTWAIDIP